VKINNSTPTTPGLPGGAAASSSRTSAQQAPTQQQVPSANVAETQVTSTEHLQAVQNVVANTPVVNADRVKEIKQAIAEGRFKINPEKIADGLLDNVKQMLRNRPEA